MSNVTAFNAGADAFRAGHKLYGAENRQPTYALRRLWRAGWKGIERKQFWWQTFTVDEIYWRASLPVAMRRQFLRT